MASILTKNLKRPRHVSSISGKASNKSSRFNQKKFWNCARSVKETVFTTPVRPKFRVWLWSLGSSILTSRRTMHLLNVCKAKRPFSTQTAIMLKDLEWPSLKTRRTIARQSLMYKIWHGSVDIDKSSYLRLYANSF